jgi:hypothetical protein
MNLITTRRAARLATTPLMALAAMVALQPGSALAETQAGKAALHPKTFTWSQIVRAPDGSADFLSTTFTSRPGQVVNPVKLVTHVQALSPYPTLRRGTVAATIYAAPAGGAAALWNVRHSLSGCGLAPTSASMCEWTDLPPAGLVRKLERDADTMGVSVQLAVR